MTQSPPAPGPLAAVSPVRPWFRRPWRGRPLPVHPLLVAAYPVLFLYATNVGELMLRDLVSPLLAIGGAALVALVVGAYLLGDARRAALVVSALAASLLLYGHVAELVGPLGVRVSIQQAAWGAGLVATAAVAFRIGTARLAGLTRALNIVTVLLVAVVLASIVPAELGRVGRTALAGRSVAGSGGATRDIYYLVFDRYGSARSLDLLYRIDDTPFLDSLRARGFSVASDSHANYVRTGLSLAATLNLDYLDDLVAAEGPDSPDYTPIYERLSNHAVGRFLQDRGYRYIHLGSYWGPTKESPIADRTIVRGGPSDFLAGLYDASALPAIGRRLGLNRSTPFRERAYAVNRFELDALDRVITEPGPSFVFAHFLLPHPPYVFLPDGSYASAESVPQRRSARDGYRDQLGYLQTRLDAVLGELLARPEAEQPIIILQADEGPYPYAYAADKVDFDWSAATRDELEIKYGIFNAMYLPGDPPAEVPSTVSSVNTFRIVLGRYFDADLPLLPDRSFTSPELRPYDLTEITDLLPPPTADP